MIEPPVYILSAEMDDDSFHWLDGLRRAHFPADRNVLSAHLTMFHQLSPVQAQVIQNALLPRAPIPMCFDEVMFLGAGVALRVRSIELTRCRDGLRTDLTGGLSRQDSQPWRPHVTVQNKVRPDVARKLHTELRERFIARAGRVTALLIWEYLGGPWKLAHRLPFGS